MLGRALAVQRLFGYDTRMLLLDLQMLRYQFFTHMV
jgi:hypothetical protein